MRKIALSIFIFLFCSFLVAQDLPQLKTNHETMMRHMGDASLLEGKHHFAYFNRHPASVYISGQQRCIYTEFNNRQLYRTVVANRNNNKVDLAFSDKICIGQKTYTLGYSLSFILGEKSGGYFATMDQEHSDLMGERADWAKILECVLKYAEELYPQIVACIKSQNMMECLQIIGPAIEVYQCISENILAVASSTQTRAIVYQTISFSWSWSAHTGFQAPPIYREMPNTIISYDSVTITHASNAWGIQIKGETIGTNTAKIVLANVSWMAYPPYSWSSQVSGSIRCVMQK